MLKSYLGAFALIAVVAPVMPAAAVQASQQQSGDFLEALGQYYETAGAPEYVNDAAGRLAIYRTTLNRLEAAPGAVRADPRYARQHLFYSIAMATTMPDAGEVREGLAQTARLIPMARQFHSQHPDDRMMTDGLARLLRVEGQFAQRSGNHPVALARYREVIGLTRSLLPEDSAAVSPYALRSLAIDLDNLSNMEAQGGNRTEADRVSADAVELFRILARRDADSRPAQGSLLVSLARRAVNFGDGAALAEAERQMAMMDQRGMMTPNYAPVRDLLAEMRRRNPL